MTPLGPPSAVIGNQTAPFALFAPFDLSFSISVRSKRVLLPSPTALHRLISVQVGPNGTLIPPKGQRTICHLSSTPIRDTLQIPKLRKIQRFSHSGKFAKPDNLMIPLDFGTNPEFHHTYRMAPRFVHGIYTSLRDQSLQQLSPGAEKQIRGNSRDSRAPSENKKRVEGVDPPPGPFVESQDAPLTSLPKCISVVIHSCKASASNLKSSLPPEYPSTGRSWIKFGHSWRGAN